VSATVTFSAVYTIFQQKTCMSSSCHDASRPAQGLDLSSESAAQANLIDVPSSECGSKKLVAPKLAAQSYLVDKLAGSGTCFTGGQMPKGASALTSSQLDTVRTWINGLP
jgi:hypothetical protein